MGATFTEIGRGAAKPILLRRTSFSRVETKLGSSLESSALARLQRCAQKSEIVGLLIAFRQKNPRRRR